MLLQNANLIMTAACLLIICSVGDEFTLCFENTCYLKSNETLTWTNAATYCSEKDSVLVSIHSLNENNYINDYVRGMDWCYIGLHDIAMEEYYQWLDGSDVNWTNWGQGEPGGFDEEDAVIMVSGGKWHDTDMSGSFYAICMVPKAANQPSLSPSVSPSLSPTVSPSLPPTSSPSSGPTTANTNHPSLSPTSSPTAQPTNIPPTVSPSIMPTFSPSVPPTSSPTFAPTRAVNDEAQSSNFSISLGSSEFVILVLVIALISTSCFIFGALCFKVLVRKNKRREEMVSTIEGAL